MIEKKFVTEKIKEFQIQEYVSKKVKNAGHSQTKLKRTPLGEKIIIHSSRPGIVVGRKGATIKELTEELKNGFNLENPQIEINEVENPNLDAQIIAERIASSLERFGSQKFKGVGHKVMSDVMQSGALGVEILISGKIPGSRAKRWRFYQGYLKKCGDIAISGVKHSIVDAQLKTGTIGIQVKIMPPDLVLPDTITILDDIKEEISEIEEESAEKEEKKKTVKKKKAKKAKKKKTVKKKKAKKVEKKEAEEEKPKDEAEPEEKKEDKKEE